ncbi:hypothetical protein BANRA_03743 [Escherichia coli]|nr:hypothetical protein BANRA_03743 [Escherichia coli]
MLGLWTSRAVSAIQFLRVYRHRGGLPWHATRVQAGEALPCCRALLTTELCQHARIHGISLVTQSFTLSESFTQRRIND